MKPPDLELHHVGCLTSSIEHSVQCFAGTALAVPSGDAVRIDSQRVRVCLLPTASGAFVELVEPDADNRFLNRLLDRNVTFYHVGLLCGDLRASEDAFVANGAKVVNRFSSEAFEGRECVFLLLANGQLVELIERPQDPKVERNQFSSIARPRGLQ